MKIPMCVIHGRFQLLHNGHVSNIILPAFEYAERVVIGICNPELSLTAYDEANPHRSENSSNPFSFWERLEMFRAFLQSQNISHERYEIVPFPINFPEKIPNYAPGNADCLLTIYDNWGRKKKTELEKQGFRVVVIKEMTPETKGISGSDVRSLIKKGDESWKNYVPESVQDYLIENDLLKKI